MDMNFILIPTIVGIITLGIYKLFELFAHRKERLTLIEKLGEKMDSSLLKDFISLKISGNSTFNTLKAACLLLGVGLGMLVAFFIILSIFGYSTDYNQFHYKGTMSIVYGASILLFGGLGLLISFLVEMKHHKKDQ